MSTPYDLIASNDSGGYYFITDNKEKYIVYFSEYYLQDIDGNEAIVTSFGFDNEGGTAKLYSKKG